jgi:sensor domain CHASE-containing protein/signal transduction histidine kinase
VNSNSNREVRGNLGWSPVFQDFHEMKLRVKTLLIVATTLVFLVVILNAVSRQVLLAGFARVEREDMERNVRRVLDAFSETINNLSVKAADWAKWDDTYRFVQDGNQEYITSNLADESLSELRLDLMLFFDNAGKLIFGRGYDAEGDSGLAVDSSDLAVIRGTVRLLHHDSSQGIVAGRVRFPRGPMNIVSRPVLRSSGQGPVMGTVIFGSYIDDEETARIGQITHLDLSIEAWNRQGRDAGTARAVAVMENGTSLVVEPHDTDTIAAYTYLTDIDGKPLLLVHVDMPRDIYRQGRMTVRYLIASIIAVGFVFGLVIIILLQKTVLSRVAKLGVDVKAIAMKGDHASRVSVAGKDELTGLGKSVNEMLTSLERVEGEVRRRNSEMEMIMKTVPAGLLSLDENFCVNPEVSASAEWILGVGSCAGRDFFEVIGRTGQHADEGVLLREYLEQVLLEPLTEREMAGLNPFETLCLHCGDHRETWVKLRYFIIRRDAGQKSHLLVVIEDVTEAKKLTDRIRKSEQENLQLKVIVEDPDLFREFLAEMNKIVAYIQDLVRLLASPETGKAVVNELFRSVHTLKGSADAYGLLAVAEIAGELEESIASCKDLPAVSPAIVGATGESFVRLAQAVAEVVDNAAKILGEDVDNASEINLRITLDKIRTECLAVREIIRNDLDDTAVARALTVKIEQRLQNLREIPARRGLAKALKIMPGLLQRCGKNITINFGGAEVPIDCELARELTSPLIHLLRNAVDHGIEDPEERIAMGKNGRGSIMVSIERDEQKLSLTVADDGRGLDPRQLKEHAARNGIIDEARACSMTDDEARKLIFIPGFTTAKTVSGISGRGVGMDVVHESVCTRLGGEVGIESEPGRGTRFVLMVPFEKPDPAGGRAAVKTD